MKYIRFFSILVLLSSATMLLAQENISPEEIIKKMEDNRNGLTNQAEMKMTIVRPDWTREITMKNWGIGNDYGMTLITAPARDKGMAFLKRKKEIWNWQPSIDRVVKLPPSMMMQSWMGSDFTNDDLVNQSTADDFVHELLDEEEIDGRLCYKIKSIPKEDVAVVWGSIIWWVSKVEYLELKVEFYDEDDYLVNTMLGKEVKNIGGKLLPSRLEMIPAEEEGHMTIVEYIALKFDEPLDEKLFSVQRMKRLR